MAKGENGQGIANIIMSNAVPYHHSMVLCLSISASFLFAIAEPIVTNTMAANINVLCASAKNVVSLFASAMDLLCQKYCMMGLLMYRIMPSISCMCDVVAVQCRMLLSALENRRLLL